MTQYLNIDEFFDEDERCKAEIKGKAIAFAEWIGKSTYGHIYTATQIMWFNRAERHDIINLAREGKTDHLITTEQLFETYLKEQDNKLNV